MEYRVLSYFEDLKDNRYKYNPGDTYPRNGHKPSNARLKELSSGDNKLKKPLIAPVGEPHPTEPAQQPIEQPVPVETQGTPEYQDYPESYPPEPPRRGRRSDMQR